MSLKALALQALQRNKARNSGATDAETRRDSDATSAHSGHGLAQPLEARIRAMARRWGYAPDELANALDLAKADPEVWLRLVLHDEKAHPLYITGE